MKISYLIRSKTDNATIYLRLRTDIHDLKVKTPFVVNPENWKAGKVKPFKVGRTVTAQGNHKLKVNKRLNELQNSLNILSYEITEAYNRNRPSLSKEWLTEIITPQQNRPKTLSEYIPTYFRLSNLRRSTEKKVQSITNRLLGFRDVKLSEVNRDFRVLLQEYLIKEGYAHNTIVKTIKVMQTVCTHAYDNGYEVHPESLRLAKKLKYEKPPHVYLTLDEIEQIECTQIEDEKLIIARDWLILSVNTGQRIGDFFLITKKDISTREGLRFFSITQRKAEKPVLIPINESVEGILKKYGGSLPPKLSDNTESNEVLYNRLIKRVCRIAEIDQPTEANLRNPKTNRYEKLTVPKWKAVSSHIGRRSFATNYFGKLPTGLLKTVTGHSSERQLLAYIGKPQSDSAIEVAKLMKQIDQTKTPLNIVHKAN